MTIRSALPLFSLRTGFVRSSIACVLFSLFALSLSADDRLWSDWKVMDSNWPGVEMRTRRDDNSGQGYGDGKYMWWYQTRSTYTDKSVNVHLGFWKRNRETKGWNPPPEPLASFFVLKPGETEPETWEMYFKKEIFEFEIRIELAGDGKPSEQKTDVPTKQPAVGQD